jgi:hypothetical protein
MHAEKRVDKSETNINWYWCSHGFKQGQCLGTDFQNYFSTQDVDDQSLMYNVVFGVNTIYKLS